MERKSGTRKLFMRIFLVTSLTLAFSIGVFADSIAPPCSYKVAANKGTAIFVMLSEQDYACAGRAGDRAEESKALREKYRSSGLYPDDKSTTPLWTVDWFSYEVLLSPDGRYVVRMGPWASNLSDEAFTFFADGKEVKKYIISDLIKNSDALQRTVSHFTWLRNKYINDTNDSFEAETLDGGRFTFDLKTGEILSQSYTPVSSTPATAATARVSSTVETATGSSPNIYIVIVLTALVTALFTGAILFLILRKKR